MTASEAARLVDHVRTWPAAAQAEWRQLLEEFPREALWIADVSVRADGRMLPTGADDTVDDG